MKSILDITKQKSVYFNLHFVTDGYVFVNRLMKKSDLMSEKSCTVIFN